MLDSDFIVGTCETMCSLAEVENRKRNRLVHFFEPAFVAEFSRSAADKQQSNPSKLRTCKAMQETLEYMLNK